MPNFERRSATLQMPRLLSRQAPALSTQLWLLRGSVRVHILKLNYKVISENLTIGLLYP